MPDSDKPNPIEDLRKGLGLLLRAAKTTIEKLPTGQIEEAVLSGAKEVGRALENVTHSVEEQFLRKPSARPSPSGEAPATDGSAAPVGNPPTDTVTTAASSPSDSKPEPPKPPGGDPKTRVG